MTAEAESRNAELDELYAEIDGLLAATLTVDDYVDLDQLRSEATHPPFDQAELETPLVPPSTEPPPPAEPTLELPAPPNPLLRLVGAGKRHERQVTAARSAYKRALDAYRKAIAEWELRKMEAAEGRRRAEDKRQQQLQAARTSYAEACNRRELEAEEHNRAVEALKANLGYGVPEAVQEYVGIVLSNSVYPDHFPVGHEYEFIPASAELRLRAVVPSPDVLPTMKGYKYIKKDDEIRATALSQRAQKDRYSEAVHQVALRTLHEVFEADRRGIIQTIALQVGTECPHPATGQTSFILFVAVAADRDSYMALDLSAVVPAATLEHLGASVSKNPFALTEASGKGVRSW